MLSEFGFVGFKDYRIKVAKSCFSINPTNLPAETAVQTD